MLKLILAGYLTVGLLVLWRLNVLVKKHGINVRPFKELEKFFDSNFYKEFNGDFFVEVALSVFLTTSYGFLIGVVIWPIFIPTIISGNVK